MKARSTVEREIGIALRRHIASNRVGQDRSTTVGLRNKRKKIFLE